MKNLIIIVLVFALVGSVFSSSYKGVDVKTQLALRKAEDQATIGRKLHQRITEAIKQGETLQVIKDSSGNECLLIPSQQDNSVRQYCRSAYAMEVDSHLYFPGH